MIVETAASLAFAFLLKCVGYALMVWAIGGTGSVVIEAIRKAVDGEKPGE